MFNKRGISPLIATVLIVGFTVALAAVIISWGSGFIQQMTERTSKTTDITLKCVTELKFDISKVVCATKSDPVADGFVESVTIENNGDVEIVGITLRAHPSNGDDVKSESLDLLNNRIGSFGVKTFSTSSTPALTAITTTANPKKVDAIVRIISEKGEDPITCTQNVRGYNLVGVPNCQATTAP
ncbi:MAG: archaellin/type IV pilin N-terminal domain-containing protein [Nanoarchaeota archaeon]